MFRSTCFSVARVISASYRILWGNDKSAPPTCRICFSSSKGIIKRYSRAAWEPNTCDCKTKGRCQHSKIFQQNQGLQNCWNAGCDVYPGTMLLCQSLRSAHHLEENKVECQSLLGGSSHLGYVVNNHGDRKSPKDRVVGPLPNGLLMAYKWG